MTKRPYHRLSLVFALMASFISLVGCEKEEEPVDGTVAIQTGQVIYAYKDQKPYIVMDMYPELRRYKKLAPPAQEEYLLRRAMATLKSPSMNKKEYQGKDECVVRMLLVKSKGEYDRNQWGIAQEIALLHINRQAALVHLQDMETLKSDELRNCFGDVHVYHERIK